MDEVLKKIFGSWSLVSWESFAKDGSTVFPLGSDALGQLMYTADGHVSAQLVRADLQPFGSDDYREATLTEMTTAWPNYFGYFGTYTIDAGNAAITHHIESGWFPNLAGTEQARYFHFDAERLVLDADTPWDRVKLIWERARRSSVAP